MGQRAGDTVSLLGQARKRFLGLSPTEASFTKRGFLVGADDARQRLEKIGITFLTGYHAALEETAFVALARRLASVEAEWCGFAFEGAAMGLALLDCVTPWRKDRWHTFTERFANSHIYMMHVGFGWALARLRRSVTPYLAQLDPLLGWLVADGYGFHEGYFGWPRYIEQQVFPARLDGYGRHAFDQGLGRSMWFVKGADVAAIVSAIDAFPCARRDDLWSGVGLACAYAGGCEATAIESLRAIAGRHLPAFAQGIAFAAKTRQHAANLNHHTETVCRLIWGRSAKAVAAITDAALKDLREESEWPAFEIWRRRIQKQIALGVART